jgi:hypothetical protein
VSSDASHPALAALAVITREFQILNLLEAGGWIAAGFVSLVMTRRYRGMILQDLIALAITLIAFGISDIVETRTGAWYRPWWLLAWKSACVLSLLMLLIRYVRRRRHMS